MIDWSYFYRLQAGDFVGNFIQTKKMILLKLNLRGEKSPLV